MWLPSFENKKNLVEPVHQIGLNHLKQFAAQAAQIYKLLNQNSLSDKHLNEGTKWTFYGFSLFMLSW